MCRTTCADGTCWSAQLPCSVNLSQLATAQLHIGQCTSSAPQAFVREYEKWPMFHRGEGRDRQQNLDEFDDARETVAALSAEYCAAEHRDFVSRI